MLLFRQMYSSALKKRFTWRKIAPSCYLYIVLYISSAPSIKIRVGCPAFKSSFQMAKTCEDSSKQGQNGANRAKRTLKGNMWDCPLIFSLIRKSRRFYITYQKIIEIGPIPRKLRLFRPGHSSTELPEKSQKMVLFLFRLKNIRKVCFNILHRIDLLRSGVWSATSPKRAR